MKNEGKELDEVKDLDEAFARLKNSEQKILQDVDVLLGRMRVQEALLRHKKPGAN